MGDSFVTIIAIFLASILMFIFPMMAVSERTDDISQLSVQTATAEFVDGIRTTGKLTYDDYDAFVQKLASTGNSYDIEMEIQVLDENTAKTAQAQMTKIGENTYYSEYTTQIMEELEEGTGKIILKEGDIVSATVKNSNTTVSQLLRNFFYRVVGNESYQVAAQHAGIVTVNGSNR